MNTVKHYELQFESDDKTSFVTTVIEGTFEQVVTKAQDVVRRRKINNMTGQHVLICPDGRQVSVE
jgi:hypothetical protein